MTQRTDEELIQWTLSGEKRAFAELVRRYEQRVIITIKSVIHDAGREDLEDIAQEVFLLVYRSLSSFRGESQFGTYLTRIVLRHCWRVAKRRRKQGKTFTSLDAEEPVSERVRDQTAGDEASDEMVLAEERHRALRNGLAELPEEFRTVLVMRVVQELPVEQVAEILGVSTGTVKSRLHRARQKMREILAEVEPGGKEGDE